MLTHPQPRGERRTIRLGAAIGALSIGAGLALAAPLPASAETVPQSYAEGRFLSGTLLGADLDRLLAVAGAEAFNNGTQSTQTVRDPLAVTALDAVTVGSGQSVQLPLGEVLQLGAVAQYAEAAQDGVSVAASGAVSDDGGIGVGSDGGTPFGTTTFDLDGLLGSGYTDALADLKLAVAAVAARAEGEREQASGDYRISGMTLRFSSPAISELTERVDSALEVVTDQLDQLAGQGGPLVSAASGVVDDLDPVLSLLGSRADVTASIDTSRLRDAVHAVLESRYADTGISFDLETGQVVVDLAKYAGGLNDLPPGTELLSDRVVDGILDAVLDTVDGLADEVVATVEDVLHDLEVRLSADVSVDVAQAPVVEEVCRTVERIIQVPVEGGGSGGSGGGLLGGLLGGLGGTVEDLLDGTTQFVDQVVRELVCENVSRPVAPLATSIDLDVAATVDELINGAGADVSATARVLGVPVTLNADLLVDRLGGVLSSGLFSGDGAAGDLVEALDDLLVDPATQGLLGGSGSVQSALTDVLSVKVNVQEKSRGSADGDRMPGDYFTQTAVRIAVGGGSLATIDLASATVGPNATADIDDPDEPGDPDNPGGCVTGCGGGGDGPSSNPTDLAFTGVSIAGILALIGALMAVGAWLLRQSRRRAAALGDPLELEV